MNFNAADKTRGKVVLVACKGALYQGLARAVEGHLPHHDITTIEHIPSDPSDWPDIDLVLIFSDGGDALSDTVSSCRRSFPDTAVGIVVDSLARMGQPAENMFDQRIVQGILPLTLPLEVWLAAISLLLSGGDYFPAQRRGEQGSLSSLPNSVSPSAARREPLPEYAALGLTAREQQILELVSEGHQNKLIAHRMALSEHTVKVHVHNLLTKLRVSNRTQAAAAFRTGFAFNPGRPNGRPGAQPTAG